MKKRVNERSMYFTLSSRAGAVLSKNSVFQVKIVDKFAWLEEVKKRKQFENIYFCW